MDEGDPFNNLLHNKTINKLRSANIFKSVRSKVKEGSTKGLKEIDITVEEKPTGEITAGAGYGTSGSTFAIGVRENNFQGKGVRLETNIKTRVASSDTAIKTTRDSLKSGFKATKEVAPTKK